VLSSGTLCSSLPGRKLNGILENDCALLVFRLKSYLTREHSILMLLSSGTLEKLCIVNVAFFFALEFIKSHIPWSYL
jgi:hypothetical protein